MLAVDEILVVATPEPSSIADAYGLIKTIVQRDPTKSVMLVANMVRSPNEGKETWRKINIVANKFLNHDIRYIGYILKDSKVVAAVSHQQPFVLSYPASSASRSMEEITLEILNKAIKTDNKLPNGVTQLKTI